MKTIKLHDSEREILKVILENRINEYSEMLKMNSYKKIQLSIREQIMRLRVVREKLE